MVLVAHIVVYGADVIVIDSVFDVFHVLMSLRETGRAKIVCEFLLGVLSSVFNTLINAIDDFTEVFLSLFAVNLR